MTDRFHPAVQQVVDVASRKGVALDIQLLPATTHTAAQAAAALDVQLGQIVKSLVFVALRPDGRVVPVVRLVSGEDRVDPAVLAAVAGEFAIRAASAHEARELTGYSIGGIPPFGHGREVRILMDQNLCAYQWIWASAGTEAAVFRVSPRTLRMLSNAFVAPLADSAWARPAVSSAIEPQLAFAAGTGA